MDEVQKTINDIIRTHGELIESLQAERDELIERLESSKKALDDIRARYLEEMRAHCEEFKAEVRRMREERDEARQVASNYRDKYVGRVGSDGSKDRLPWEQKNERTEAVPV